MTTVDATICFKSSELMPKKHRLGPQNGSESSRPRKLLKILNKKTDETDYVE